MTLSKQDLTMKKYLICFLAICILSFSIAFAQSPDSTLQRRDTIRPALVTADMVRTQSSYQIKPVPASFVSPAGGEPDIIKMVQTLPGVSPGVDGFSSFYVRGGNFGNNVVTLDGVPIYGLSHLLGMVSIVPSSIIKDCTFQVGGFSAEQFNFASSYMEISTKDSLVVRPQGSVAISTLMASASLMVPLIKEKASMLVSLRYSPLGFEYNKLRPRLSLGVDAPDSLNTLVGDAYSKLNIKVGKKGMLSASCFYSADKYDFSMSELSRDYVEWYNLIASAAYSGQINDDLTFAVNAYYNNHNSFQATEKQLSSHEVLQLMSTLKEFSIGARIKYRTPNNIDLRFGLDTRQGFFNPGAYRNGSVLTDNKKSSLIIGLSGEIDMSDPEKYDLKVSARGNFYLQGGKLSFHPEIRAGLRYHISPSLTAEATFDQLSQFYHTLEGLPTGWSIDMKILSTNKVKPESATQVYAGVAWDNQRWKVKAGGYYKYMRNLVYFTNAAVMFSPALTSWESEVESGKGRSYGGEFQAGYSDGRLDVTVSYTISKTDRIFPSINNGNPFPARFDRRHILSVDGQYPFSRSSSFEHGASTRVSLMSGHMESMRSAIYKTELFGMTQDDPLYKYFCSLDYYTHPNNYRMPTNFRWDLGYYLTFMGKRVSTTLNLGVYNLTNRHNAVSLYYDDTDKQWKQLSIFPIMPSLMLRIDF